MEYPTKQVIQYDLKGKEIAWHPTLAAAAKAAGVTKAAMSIYLAGKRKSPVCAGYVWKEVPAQDAEQICKPVEEEKPKKELPVDPHSNDYKWDSWAQKIKRRTEKEMLTKRRNASLD